MGGNLRGSAINRPFVATQVASLSAAVHLIRMPKDHCLSVEPYVGVPALPGLPEIQHETALVSKLTLRFSSIPGNVNLGGGCLIIKSVKYVHQLTHIVNAVRSEDPTAVLKLLVIARSS